MSYLLDSPCHFCEKRYPACHGQCEEYKVWKARMIEIREASHIERENNRAISNLHFDRYTKLNHRR